MRGGWRACWNRAVHIAAGVPSCMLSLRAVHKLVCGLRSRHFCTARERCYSYIHSVQLACSISLYMLHGSVLTALVVLCCRLKRVMRFPLVTL